MPTFFPPLIIINPLTSRRQRGTWIERMTRGHRIPTGKNIWVLNDEYVNEQWPKVSLVQPPSFDWVEICYSGGSTYVVTEERAAQLRAAGLKMEEDS